MKKDDGEIFITFRKKMISVKLAGSFCIIWLAVFALLWWNFQKIYAII